MKTEKEILAYLRREIKLCKAEIRVGIEEEWYEQVASTSAELRAYQSLLDWYQSKCAT